MEALIAYYDTVFSYMPGYLKATLLVLQMTVVITLLSWVIGIATALVVLSFIPTYYFTAFF